MITLESIIVGLIVVAAAVFCGWTMVRFFTSPTSGCHCNGTCPLPDPTQCDQDEADSREEDAP